MDSVSDGRDRLHGGSLPVVIAHRGASALAPENTLAAYLTALSLGVGGIELDVHLTVDGELVCIHDETVDRTTNGSGWVGRLSLVELRSLDAGSWFYGPGVRPLWTADQLRIPLLAEVLDLVRGRCTLCIELKHPELYPGIEERLIDALEQERMLDPENPWAVIVLSFDADILRRVAELRPELPSVQATPPGFEHTPAFFEEVRQYARGISPFWAGVTPAFVEQAHSHDLLVFPYTADFPDEMRALMQADVDAIITDNPVQLQRIVRGE